MSAFIKLNTREVPFKQQPDGTFTSKTGYIIREVPRPDTGEPVPDWRSETVWQLVNPEGEVIDTSDYGIGFSLPDDQVPRRVYIDHSRIRVKWSPAHFTKGTVVRVCPTISEGENGSKLFTVDHVIQNGPSSFCINTTEIKQDGHLKGEVVGFNIDHVKEIVHRPAGIVKVVQYSSNLKDVVNSGKYVTLNQLFDLLLAGPACNSATDTPGTCFDAEKLLKRLKGMGLVKREIADVGDYVMMANKIKRREALKFIRKNPHWCRETVKAAVAADQAMWEDYYQCDELELV